MFASILVYCALLAWVVLLLFGIVDKVVMETGTYRGLLIFGVVFAVVLVGLTFGRIRLLKNISAAEWSIAFLFLVMPYIYVFGTNVNYWGEGNRVLIFWLFAGLTLLRPIARERATWSFVIPIVLVTQVLTATFLYRVLEVPYYRNSQPLRLNESVVEFWATPYRSSLRLPANQADYVVNAQTVTQNAGFKVGDPMINLSGRASGILYAIGAESIGSAWFLEGYSGSLIVAKAVLGRVPCEKIAAAWVLLQPADPRRAPVEVMSTLGAAFPENYELVDTWQTPKTFGIYTQELYKPMAPDETLKACQSMRKGKVE
jgi:hypothetical protein